MSSGASLVSLPYGGATTIGRGPTFYRSFPVVRISADFAGLGTLRGAGHAQVAAPLWVGFTTFLRART